MNILVADESAIRRDEFRDILINQGHEVRTVKTGIGAVEEFRRQTPDITIVRRQVGECSAPQVIAAMNKINKRVNNVAAVNTCKSQTMHRSIEAGANALLTPPIEVKRQMYNREGDMVIDDEDIYFKEKNIKGVVGRFGRLLRATFISSDREREEQTVYGGVTINEDESVKVETQAPEWLSPGDHVVVSDTAGSVERSFVVSSGWPNLDA